MESNICQVVIAKLLYCWHTMLRCSVNAFVTMQLTDHIVHDSSMAKEAETLYSLGVVPLSAPCMYVMCMRVCVCVCVCLKVKVTDCRHMSGGLLQTRKYCRPKSN